MSFSLSAFQNLDLLTVGIAVAGMLVLGFVVLFNNLKSISNRIFFFLAVSASVWGIVNYAFYLPQISIELSLWLLRLVMFFAVWAAFFTFEFVDVFPAEEMILSWKYTWMLIPLTVATSLLMLTPIVFADITARTADGHISAVVNGPGIFVFGLMVMFLNVGAVALLIRKIFTTKSKEQRALLKTVLVGIAIMLFLITIFNFLLPAFFDNSRFISLGALFLFPFIAFTAYAIYRHHLFNLKVATTAFLGFLVTIFSFVNIIYSVSIGAIVINVVAFVIVLGGSIKIVKDTLSLRNLTEELSETNVRQETLIHFIGHEVKGSLAKDEGSFAALSEGDFGELQDGMKSFVERALAESRQSVAAVANILRASNLKKGTMVYTKEPFDLKALVTEAVEKERSVAEQKGLTLSFTADESSFQMTGDKVQINDHVLRNLIDNAINYTPSGSINVSLEKTRDKSPDKERIIFKVKDTGVGITEEDKKRLFTEGGHGKYSQTINAHSTGYGLYIAKQIVVANGGTIRAESEGAGKGSTFIVEFPVEHDIQV